MPLSYNVVSIDSSSTLSTTVDTVFVNPTSSQTVNVNLPAISGNGQRYLIKRCDLTESTVVVIPNGSNTIGGASTQSLSQGQIIELTSYDTEWVVVLNIAT